MRRPSRSRIAVVLVVAVSSLSGVAIGAASTTTASTGGSSLAPATSVRVEPLKRLFPLLDLYYRLDPARRSRFRIAYRLHAGERGATARVSLLGATPTPLPVSADGWFERLPTPDELERPAQVRIEIPAGPNFGVSLVPEMTGPMEADMDAATIAAAVDQLDAEVHDGNPIGLLVPHFGRVQFRGGQGAVVVSMSGEAHATPLQHGQPVLTLRSLRGASRVRFDVAPERVLILPN